MSTRKSTRRSTSTKTAGTTKPRKRRRRSTTPRATASRTSIKPTKTRKHWNKRSRRQTTTTSTPTAWIGGNFQGQIVSSSQLHIDKNATCNANVKAPSVQIDGTIRGTVVAQHTMKLGTHSNVQGTIVTEKLLAAEGACFNGQCHLGRYRKAA